MNLYNLKIFADTARLASMTKSAELNNLSRPAVSQAIKKLEIELGVELLVHQRRFVELTQSGRLLLKKSEDLLSEAEKITFLIRHGQVPMVRDFKIGSARTLATFNLTKVLGELRSEYPDVSLQVHMANSGALIRKLENREIDIAFMIGDETLEDSKQTVVGRGHFVLVKPKDKKEEHVTYALTEKRPETERARVLFERTTGRSLPVFAEIHSWDAIWHSVNEGICGGLVPDFLFTSKPARSNLAYSVVLPKVFPYEIKVIHLGSKANDPLVKSFIALFKKSNPK
jgi:DNA-binding transcriptional LysR family regulator